MSENDPVIQLDRSLYKKIKTMDRLKMEEILQSVFNYGFKEALQLKNNVMDLNLFRREISKIKGIGENRLNEVMKVIESNI
jgi:ribosomal protein L29